MNLKSIGLLGAALLALAAFGCETKTTVQQAGQEAPGITVSGQGTASGTPDVALLTLGVDVEKPTVGEARTQAADSMNKMLDALKQGGVAEKDIQTTRFSVQPQYDYALNGKPTLRGFSVSNVVTAKIRKIDDAGTLIDAALGVGGDDARIESLVFTIDDPSVLEEQARKDAMAEAKKKADVLASEGGVQLGTPIAISETNATQPITYEGRALAVPAAADQTPIQLGELEVQIQVQVVYGLK